MIGLRTPAAQRVAELVVSVADGDRLSRGRACHRKGQVRDVVVSSGYAEAKVMGSRSDPYTVVLAVRVAGDNVTCEAGHDPGAAVPGPGDIGFSCSCPDWGDPCKHGVAAMLSLAREIDDDVSLLLRWRGIEGVVVAPPSGTESLIARAAAAPVGSLDPGATGSDEEDPASLVPDPASAVRELRRRLGPAARSRPDFGSIDVGSAADLDRRQALEMLREGLAGALTDPAALGARSAAVRDHGGAGRGDPGLVDGPLEAFFAGSAEDRIGSIERLGEDQLDAYHHVRILLENIDAAPVIADALDTIADHWLTR